MPIVAPRSVLTGIVAAEIMRPRMTRLTSRHSIADGIRRMIKYRSNTVLVDDGDGTPPGIVSKTDTMLAYYGGLPPETPIGDIMMGPVQTCYRDDSLESVLDTMHAAGIHQLFVHGTAGDITGVISYGDIVGLVYRYCRRCERSCRKPAESPEALPELQVRDVMSTPAAAIAETDAVTAAMDVLTARRVGAVLVTAAGDIPVGVISKTDLATAYLHGVAPEEAAAAVMTTPATTCTPDTLLSEAIQIMLLRDIQRIFIRKEGSGPAIGVLSLSDAARFRSGTCRACTTSRLMSQG